MSRVLSVQPTSAVPVGGIIDAAGLNDVSTLDGSTFLRVNSAAFFSGSLLPTAAKTLLQQNYLFQNIADPAVTAAIGTINRLNLATEPALLTGIRTFPYGTTNGSGDSGALTFDSGGYTFAPFGVTGVGGGQAMTSNGTTLVAYYIATDTTVRALTSTNGKTWTDTALTGTNTFSALSHTSLNGRGDNSFKGGIGECRYDVAGYGIAYWFGSRFVLIVKNAGNFTASISTNGTTFGGDATTAVLGSTTIAANTAQEAFWHRNGNAGFFVLGTAARFTSDGGVTWANITNPPATNARMRVNASTAAKITAINTNSNTLRVSADTGATWTSRTLPFTATEGGSTIAYFGSVGILTNGGAAFVSLDDFATITALPNPSGVTGLPRAVVADANRIYIYYSSNQVVTTTNGTTFTVRNVANAGLPGSTTNVQQTNIAAIDASNVVITPFTAGGTLRTTDGGVTWRWASFDGSDYKRAAAPEGGGFIVSAPADTSVSLATPANLVDPGGYRAVTSAVSPLRTGAIPYARVA